MASLLRARLYTVDFAKSLVGKASTASSRYAMLRLGPIRVTAKNAAEKIMLKLSTGFRRGDVITVEVAMNGLDQNTVDSGYRRLIIEDLESQVRQLLADEKARDNLLLQDIDIHDLFVESIQLTSNLSETATFKFQVHTH